MAAQVISVSRRTDVPAFHARWFLARLAAGFADYRNPFGGKIHRVPLAPEDVRAFVFWTRNAAPLMQGLSRIEAHGAPFYFLYTLTDYPRALERATPPLDQAVRTFRRLAERIGPERVRWRYDPIVLAEGMDADFHRRSFERIARLLEGATGECLVSFLDLYGKVRRNLAALAPGAGNGNGNGKGKKERKKAEEVKRAEEGIKNGGLRLITPGREARRALAAELAEIAAARGIRLLACCEDDLIAGKVEKGRCVDSELIGRIAPSAGRLPLRPTREECGCAASRDIGAYDTCPHGCVYCYANASPEAALRRYRKADPAAPML